MNGVVRVSIIVPVYNVSKYLRRCLDSCLFQTLGETEIIIVDDASPDPVDRVICDEYQSLYPDKVNVVIHDTNKGLGGARNTGIESANGEYLIFVDSDDYIDFEMCERLYNEAQINNADIVLSSFYVCNLNSVSMSVCYRNNYLDAQNNPNKLGMSFSACAMLIKKEVIVSNNLYFTPNKLFEEICIVPLWLIAGSNITCFNERPLYFYIKGRVDSITSKDFKYLIKELFQSYEILLREVRCRFPEKLKLVSEILLRDLIKTRMPKILDYNLYCLTVKYGRIILKEIVSTLNNNSILSNHAIYLLFEQHSKEEMQNRLIEFNRFAVGSWTDKDWKAFFSDRIPERVCVWGYGKLGRRLVERFAKLNIPCKVTDININLHSTIAINGVEIKPWNQLCDDIKTVIIAVSGETDNIRCLLDCDMEIFSM